MPPTLQVNSSGDPRELAGRRRASRRRFTASMAVVSAVVLVGVVACSSGDDGSGSAPVTAPSVTAGDGTSETDGDTAEVAGDEGGSVGDSGSGENHIGGDDGIDTDEPPAPTLPEIGVPGLDAEEVVCRAWSRFAGSFQVAAVAASFGDDPIGVAVLEVAASPVVTAAAAEMIEVWPAELAEEADAVAEGYLGPFARRSGRALDRLVDAGATDEQLVRLGEAWLDALAQRDPSEVLPELILDGDLADLVEIAAVRFAAEVVPIPVDPSLITDVEVPLTQEFLFETCPDRGTLAGGEIVE